MKQQTEKSSRCFLRSLINPITKNKKNKKNGYARGYKIKFES